MKIFIIGPVRNVDDKTAKVMYAYSELFERSGYQVHLPARDTDQSACSIDICRQNMEAIRDADEVHIFYKPESQGVHFDMGVAFALGKKIIVIENAPHDEGKSFPKMLIEWMERV